MRKSIVRSMAVAAAVLVSVLGQEQRCLALVVPITDEETCEDRIGFSEKERERIFRFGETVRTALRAQKFKTALDTCNQALKVFPDNAELLHLRANTYEAMGRTEDALTDIEKCITKLPGREVLMYERARLKFARKDYDGALKDCDTAMRYGDRRTMEAFALRARAFKALGKTGEAIENAKDCVYHAKLLGRPGQANYVMKGEFGDFPEPLRRVNDTDVKSLFKTIDTLKELDSPPSESDVLGLLQKKEEAPIDYVWYSRNLPLWNRHYWDRIRSDKPDALNLIPNPDQCTIVYEDLLKYYDTQIQETSGRIGACGPFTRKFKLHGKRCTVYFDLSLHGEKYLERVYILWNG